MTHLVLIGLMGAGKSSVGRRCATLLDRPFVDTDELVEVVAGRTVADIFATDGEREFRARERAAVADACAAPEPSVISCGGGAVLDAANRRALRAHGVVVWLDAPPAVLAARAASDASGSVRPLLASGDGAVTLQRLDRMRRPVYEAAAHARVDTDGLDEDAVAGRVLAALAAREGA